MAGATHSENETYSEAETVARMNAALSKALHTPRKPQEPSKAKLKEKPAPRHRA